MTYRKPPFPTSRYLARQRRRDKKAAWAADAQARLKQFEEEKKKEDDER
jgi:hypothetical protein